MPDQAKSNKKVLLVEDDQGIRDTLETILEFEGYQPVSAANGLEALNALGEGTPPALVLLDLMMPVMNGWEFREAMLKDPSLRSIPVVVLSAYLDRSKPIQAEGFIRKPVNFDVLLREIRRFCGEPLREAG